ISAPHTEISRQLWKSTLKIRRGPGSASRPNYADPAREEPSRRRRTRRRTARGGPDGGGATPPPPGVSDVKEPSRRPVDSTGPRRLGRGPRSALSHKDIQTLRKGLAMRPNGTPALQIRICIFRLRIWAPRPEIGSFRRPV